MASPSISLVIPALNEERGIVATLKRVPKEISEIIVVDGGSKDRTVELAEANGARVVVEPQRGYGLAYKRGFAAAKGDIIVTSDADGTYPIELFPYVVEYLIKRDLTFVNCSRLPLVDRKSMRFWNRIGNVGLSLAATGLYLHTFRDISSGMWALRREFIDQLELNTNGWCFSNEIKLEAYTVNPKGFGEFVVPFDERVGDTHNVTIWATGVEVLGFMAYERFLHFMRARVVDKNRTLAKPLDGAGGNTEP